MVAAGLRAAHNGVVRELPSRRAGTNEDAGHRISHRTCALFAARPKHRGRPQTQKCTGRGGGRGRQKMEQLQRQTAHFRPQPAIAALYGNGRGGRANLDDIISTINLMAGGGLPGRGKTAIPRPGNWQKKSGEAS